MDEVLEQSAHELIARRGAGAIDWLQERIRQLEEAGDAPSVDATYRLLSVVERLLAAN